LEEAMKERRDYVRLATAVSLDLYSQDAKRNLGRGFITNLGEGGIALEISKNFRLGERLMLKFSLPNADTFNVLGEIIYIKEGIFSRAYGARFLKAEPNDIFKLKDFITEHVK
jgi:hypothetical protein